MKEKRGKLNGKGEVHCIRSSLSELIRPTAEVKIKVNYKSTQWVRTIEGNRSGEKPENREQNKN